MSEGRITREVSFLDLVDTLGRGGTAEWKELYREAQSVPELRAEIRRALPLVDPEVGAGREIWEFLLSHLDEEAGSRGS